MLYHIAQQSQLSSADLYQPPSLEKEGFIHLSYAYQRRLTQQRYYTGQENLVLLTVDPSKLAAPLRQENGFPHLYGPLEMAAVVATSALPVYRDLTVTLLSAVYPESGLGLAEDVAAAKASRAGLVVLPELALNRWAPATRTPSAQDVDGGRTHKLGEIAREAAIALLGGVIEGARNVAYLWGNEGKPWLRYEKMHLPSEEGFWETHHYSPGVACPEISDECGFPLGIQLCSDTNRPFGAMALRAQGAGAILIPRATEKETYPRWRRMFQALAQMTACYVLSVNRPAPELGVALGGPSVAIGPDGEIIEESEERLLSVKLEHRKVVEARESYPGYLEVPVETYARAWAQLAQR